MRGDFATVTYWAQRVYGSGSDREIGSEATPEAWVANLVTVFREVRRVLRPDGVLFVNVGDKYAGSGGAGGDYNEGGLKASANGTGPAGSQHLGGYKPKDLIGLPWALAFALRADGWVLRSDIVWAKANPMPQSVRDRPTTAHEYLFMFSKATWKGPEQRRFGSISNEDARWLAMFLDTEGNITVKRTSQESVGWNPWYGIQLAFANTHRGLLEEAQRIIGEGTVMERPGKNAPMFYYQLSNQAAAALLYRVYPYLIVKQRQARLGIYLQDLIATRGKKRPGGFRSPEWAGQLERLWQTNKALNHFGSPDISWIPEPTYGHWDSQPYYFDAEAVREPGSFDPSGVRGYREGVIDNGYKPNEIRGEQRHEGRNLRSVWTMPSEPFSVKRLGKYAPPPSVDHYALFPSALPERCIRAGTSEKGCCARCGAPWARQVRPTAKYQEMLERGRNHASWKGDRRAVADQIGNAYGDKPEIATRDVETTGWAASCGCGADTVPCTVLDPFSGFATTGLAAHRLGRSYIGIELRQEYIDASYVRLREDAPMLAEVSSAAH